ncbi:MAG: TlpA family protein disulfide reductase [Caldimonas manganoxidans]|nr:TlpA family protein disulfide reductase [Caldimonas manganoxidans]
MTVADGFVPMSRRTCLRAAAAWGLLSPAAWAAPRAWVRPWTGRPSTPPLALPALEGGVRRLADWRGQVVLLNFWASWCEPCVSEMPALLRLAESRADQGLVVLAVNYQESEAKVRSFLDLVFGEIPQALPVLMDRDGQAAKAWTARVLPTTVIVDRSGQPRWSVMGEWNWTGPQARELIEPLLRSGR